jgi:hypothetical protein
MSELSFALLHAFSRLINVRNILKVEEQRRFADRYVMKLASNNELDISNAQQTEQSTTDLPTF